MQGYVPVVVPTSLAELRLHKDSKSADRIKLHAEFLKVLNQFIHQNKLNRFAVISRMYKFHKRNYLRILFFDQLVKGNKKKAFKKLFKLTVKFPVSIITRWYWGGIKRLIVGVASDDLFCSYVVSGPLIVSLFDGTDKNFWRQLSLQK